MSRPATSHSGDEGAEIEHEEEEDEVAAGMREYTEVLRRKWLTDRGFEAHDVNKPRARFPGDTAAHIAVCEGNMEMLLYLHEHGAIFDVVNQIGDKPVQAGAAVAVKAKIATWVNQRISEAEVAKELAERKTHF